MDPRIEAAITDVATSFTEFKSANDRRLKAIEEDLIRVETNARRPGGGGPGRSGNDDAETRAFLQFCRTGEHKAALRTDVDPGAGYLAPAGFEAELARNLVQFSPIRSVARVSAMGSGQINLPRRTQGTSAYWVAETADRTETEPVYANDALVACEMACFIDVSNAMLEDSAIDLEAELRDDLAESFGNLEGTSFLRGILPGQPEGILTRPITTLNSGAATAVTADALRSALFALPQRYRTRATWAMNSTTAGSVSKLKTSGSGDYIWQASLAAGMPDTLLGRPVIECVDMPDEGAGLKPVLIGDFIAGYRIGDRIGLNVLRDPYSRAAQGTTRFHARRRVAGVVRLVEAFRTITCSV